DGKNYSVRIEKGMKVFVNSDIPSLKELDISPREVFCLNGLDEANAGTPREFVWPRYLDMDRDHNIYIIDRAGAAVKKFDKSGTFIKSFGRQGAGPGEMKFPYLIAHLEEIIYVADPVGRRMVTFDRDGTFIENIIVKSGFPNVLKTVGKNNFIGFMNKYRESEEGAFVGYSLVLLDMKFTPGKILSEYEIKYNPSYNNFLDRLTAYAVGKDKIFVAENSDDSYRINVFDFSGNPMYAIEKEYSSIAFSSEELAQLNRTLKQTMLKLGVPEYQPVKAKYKKCINGMFYDKEGRLLVAVSQERSGKNRYDFVLDVFKDGVFLKTITLDIGRKAYDFIKLHDEKVFFKSDRIYYLDETEATIRGFSY
ncbi:MAG: 6-bladed beta-propeller, partial [bacterium]|nr:6-bladed beta-propeller [bacterium]